MPQRLTSVVICDACGCAGERYEFNSLSTTPIPHPRYTLTWNGGIYALCQPCGDALKTCLNDRRKAATGSGND